MPDSAVHFSMATVASAAGWTTDRTRKWFLRQGLATKFGGRWVVTSDTLRSVWPALADRMIGALEAADGA